MRTQLARSSVAIAQLVRIQLAKSPVAMVPVAKPPVGRIRLAEYGCVLALKSVKERRRVPINTKAR